MALLAAAVICDSAQTQQSQPRQTPPPARTTRPEDKDTEQVQKPMPFSDQELKVIRNANTLPTERLVELMRVYDKLDNEAMTQILVRLVLKRNPRHAEALRINATLDPDEEVRSVGYLDKLASQVLAGQKVDDPEGVAAQAGALALDNRAQEAVKLLEALWDVNFKEGRFPFLQDLASAYQDAGLYAKSEVAYQAILEDPASPVEAKQDAQRALPVLAIQKRIAGLRERAMENPDEGLELSSKLLAEMPEEPLAVAFRIESLDRAGRYADAVELLEKLKAESKTPDFEHQEMLAYAYYGAKQWTQARQAFLEIRDGAGYSEESRAGAEKMLGVLKVDERLEKGTTALKSSDVTTAKQLLEELERDFPKDRDVFAFRCLVMAKTGQSKEALEMLLRMRVEAANKGELFMEMDTLADVYMERKEYILAISAYEDIISNRAYDAAMRSEAAKGLEDAKRAQQIYKAYLALESGNPKVAKRYADDLRAMSPKDPEVQVLGADIDLAYGRAEAALSEYERLKAKYYRAGPFPGQSGIGEAQFRLGNWEEALTAYIEIIERPGHEPDDVWSARWDRRSLLPYLKQHLTLDSHFQDESEGSIFSQDLGYSTPWLDGWRFIVSAREDFISLDEAQRITRDGDVSRFESQVAVQRRLKGGYFAEASVGGTEDNVLYGARFGKFSSTGVGWGSIGWSLGFSGNASADYSLPLRAINGRENRIDFDAGGYVHPRVRFDLNTYASWVHVDGDQLGSGYGGSGKLEYILKTETRKRPEVTVGYFGEYTRFHAESEVPSAVARELRSEELQVRRALSANEEVRKALPSNHGREIFDSLVEPETNRHGAVVTVRKRLDLDWSVYAEAGVYRDFIGKSWEYTVAAGVEYWLSDSSMLYAEIRYDSNGVASDQGVWDASLGAEITF
jgi:tetratricopeptide (TPR) repeat protein